MQDDRLSEDDEKLVWWEVGGRREKEGRRDRVGWMNEERNEVREGNNNACVVVQFL